MEKALEPMSIRVLVKTVPGLRVGPTSTLLHLVADINGDVKREQREEDSDEVLVPDQVTRSAELDM
eukprot:5105019-Amphidinium_carterae.1